MNFTEQEEGRVRAAMMSQIYEYITECKHDEYYEEDMSIYRSIMRKLGMTFNDKGDFQNIE